MLEKTLDPKSRYTSVKELGKGSFGNVWLVRSNYSFRSYVKKEMSERCNDEKERDLALNEAHILARLKHKNIIRYKDAYFDDGKLCIIMEYADDGDLYTKIKNQNGRRFDDGLVLDWFVQLVMAVKYIHDQHILHRDLKSQNIFLTVKGILKVGDFGISRLLGCTSDHAKTVVGTPYYLSPEICRREPYNQKSDMWSLGVILYEMTMLAYPFVGETLSELVANILVGRPAPLGSNTNPLISDLVLVLLQLEPRNRPSATNVLGIPVVARITNTLVNRTNELTKNGREGSFDSPLIERKRDRSFKYDVVFDLTLNRTASDSSSVDCKKSSRNIDRFVNRTGCYESGYCTRNNNGNQLTGSAAFANSSDMPGIIPKSASFVRVNDIGTVPKESRKTSEINRKRTFRLHHDAVDGKSGCHGAATNKNIRDIDREVTLLETDPIHDQEPSTLDHSSCKRRCLDALTVADIRKPMKAFGAGTDGTSYVESVGSVTDSCDVLCHTTENESSEPVRGSHICDMNQRLDYIISRRSAQAIRGTFNISDLSPKIKAKCLDKVRKSSSKNMERKADNDSTESDLGVCELPTHKQEMTFMSSKRSSSFSTCAITRKSPDVEEHNYEFDRNYRRYEENTEDCCKMETHRNDVLVFVDDEEFFPAKSQSTLDRINPRNRVCSEKQQPSIRIEADDARCKQAYKRLEKLESILENRIGLDKLKLLCNFLRKVKFAILEDEVLCYVYEILGEDMDQLLPMIFELFLLKKRLSPS